MIREKEKQPKGKFFLCRKTHYARREFYHESGQQNVGTPDESDYINWTRYLDEARGFDTLKTARRMAAMVWERYGEKVEIIDRRGEVVG